MPTFTPPLVDGIPFGDHKLWRFYDSWAMGQTVWKDQLGVWHATIYPYRGGQIDRVFRKGALISETIDSSVTSLDNAAVVYEGGHDYVISEAAAAELQAAGFTVGIVSEDFNKADGALGPDLTWTRGVFTNAFPNQVVSNQVQQSVNLPGSFEDIQVPSPNVGSPNVTVTMDIVNVTRTGSGSYVIGTGGVTRYQTSDNSTRYRGYAFEVGRDNVFAPPVDLWHLLIWKIEGSGEGFTGQTTLISSAFTTLANVTLPGVVTFTINGGTMNLSFTHGGPGPTLIVPQVTDTLFPTGQVTLGSALEIAGTDSGSITADNFKAVEIL